MVVVSKFDKHMEMLAFLGMRNFSFLRPQYLVKAILEGATAVAFKSDL